MVKKRKFVQGEGKAFVYQSKSLEEVQAMSFEEFVQCVDSRTRRKLTRGFSPAEKLFLEKIRGGKKDVKTHCRDMVVLPEFIEKVIHVHNGKEFVAITILPEMIGHRFGELVLTRKPVRHGDIKPKKKTEVRK